MVPLRMIEPVTLPKEPFSTGSVVSVIARGLSVVMFSRSTEKPNGSVLSTLLVVSRSLMMAGESQPSLLRSLTVWSEIRNRPPPFWTNFITAVFSASLSRTLGSGSTNSSKLARSSAPPVP